MPYSYNQLKEEARNFLLGEIQENDRVLDIGPGAGTYARLMPEIKMDCLEIYEPYVKRFHLGLFYNTVHIGDARTFQHYDWYSYLILGDVFEHLSSDDARAFLDRNQDKRMLIAVPYLFEQGEWEGNAHEAHQQPDLTPAIMQKRYPELTLAFGDEQHGYYIKHQP